MTYIIRFYRSRSWSSFFQKLFLVITVLQGGGLEIFGQEIFGQCWKYSDDVLPPNISLEIFGRTFTPDFFPRVFFCWFFLVFCGSIFFKNNFSAQLMAFYRFFCQNSEVTWLKLAYGSRLGTLVGLHQLLAWKSQVILTAYIILKIVNDPVLYWTCWD